MVNIWCQQVTLFDSIAGMDLALNVSCAGFWIDITSEMCACTPDILEDVSREVYASRISKNCIVDCFNRVDKYIFYHTKFQMCLDKNMLGITQLGY